MKPYTIFFYYLNGDYWIKLISFSQNKNLYLLKTSSGIIREQWHELPTFRCLALFKLNGVRKKSRNSHVTDDLLTALLPETCQQRASHRATKRPSYWPYLSRSFVSTPRTPKAAATSTTLAPTAITTEDAVIAIGLARIQDWFARRPPIIQPLRAAPCTISAVYLLPSPILTGKTSRAILGEILFLRDQNRGPRKARCRKPGFCRVGINNMLITKIRDFNFFVLVLIIFGVLFTKAFFYIGCNLDFH